MSSTSIGYEGHVNITYFINGKKVRYKGKNEGLNALFQYICKCLAGNVVNAASEKPTYLDIRCQHTNSEGAIVEDSCLYNTISLSNPEYQYDSTYETWVAKFTITLSYNMINFTILDKYPNADIYLYLLAANQLTSTAITPGNGFARLRLLKADFDLTSMVPGTQALIEWTMVVRNVTSD